MVTILKNIVISLDLGKMNDYTALVIVEHNNIKELAKTEKAYILRYINRFRLGTTYTEVAENVKKLMTKLTVRPAFDPVIKPLLLIDGTGVGEGVFEIFLNKGLKPKKIVITGGNKINVMPGGWNVPKRELISAVTGCLERQQLIIPDNVKFKEILLAEMQNFQVKITPSGYDSYSHREGEHDDILLALSQALWFLKKQEKQVVKAVPRLLF